MKTVHFRTSSGIKMLQYDAMSSNMTLRPGAQRHYHSKFSSLFPCFYENSLKDNKNTYCLLQTHSHWYRKMQTAAEYTNP